MSNLGHLVYTKSVTSYPEGSNNYPLHDRVVVMNENSFKALNSEDVLDMDHRAALFNDRMIKGAKVMISNDLMDGEVIQMRVDDRKKDRVCC